MLIYTQVKNLHIMKETAACNLKCRYFGGGGQYASLIERDRSVHNTSVLAEERQSFLICFSFCSPFLCFQKHKRLFCFFLQSRMKLYETYSQVEPQSTQNVRNTCSVALQTYSKAFDLLDFWV